MTHWSQVRDRSPKAPPCIYCEGKGKVIFSFKGPGAVGPEIADCPNCVGTGRRHGL